MLTMMVPALLAVTSVGMMVQEFSCNSNFLSCLNTTCLNGRKHRDINAISMWLHIQDVVHLTAGMGPEQGFLSIAHPWLLKDAGRQM